MEGMNVVFLVMVLVAFGFAGWRQIFHPVLDAEAPPMQALSTAMIESAAGAVDLAIGLVGVMTLFLGLMKVAEAGGMLTFLARLIRPLMVRLFPDVPSSHPAMGAMILNLSANALGLGNAATPMGIRAMQELEHLNPNPGTATNAMVLFLAINTSSVTLLPTGVIAMRAAFGSADPSGILPTTLFATLCSTTAAIIAAKLYSRWSRVESSTSTTSIRSDPIKAHAGRSEDGADQPADPGSYPLWVTVLALSGLIILIPVAITYGSAISPWIIPGLMVFFLCFGAFRKVRIYEVLVDGAKEGFQVALRIIPYLVAILVAVGMLRASGALNAFVQLVGPWTARFGLPAEALPMALLRPLSGSGAYGIMTAIIKDPAIGPDSYVGYLVSTLQGSTETTFYVLAVYFGAIRIRRSRHALATALTADLVGIIAAVIACRIVFS